MFDVFVVLVVVVVLVLAKDSLLRNAKGSGRNQ